MTNLKAEFHKLYEAGGRRFRVALLPTAIPAFSGSEPVAVRYREHDRCAGRALFGEGTKPCARPSAYFYYHSLHASTAIHEIVGDKLYEELTAG